MVFDSARLDSHSRNYKSREVKQSRGEIVLFIEAMPQDKMPFYTRTGAMENFHLKFKFNSLGKQAKRNQVSPFFSNK